MSSTLNLYSTNIYIYMMNFVLIRNLNLILINYRFSLCLKYWLVSIRMSGLHIIFHACPVTWVGLACSFYHYNIHFRITWAQSLWCILILILIYVYSQLINYNNNKLNLLCFINLISAILIFIYRGIPRSNWSHT